MAHVAAATAPTALGRTRARGGGTNPNPNPDPDPNPNPNPNPDPNPNPNSIPNPIPNPNQGRPPRWRVAGLVHVYLAPHARGTPGGAALMRGARRCLRRMGISHEFTLADDTGSGKLRRWCAALSHTHRPAPS